MSTWAPTGPWRELSAPGELLRTAPPVIPEEAVPACPSCGAERFRPFAIGFDYELLTCANPWRFVECTECGHVWLNPRPALSTLPIIYPPTYYAYNYETQIHPIAVWGKKVLDRFKMRGILGHLSRPPRSFLDVGCGDGRFLRVMSDRGLARSRVYGLELDEGVVQRLSADGYQALAERIETCEAIPDDSIDLATMFHVIEHVADPDAVVARVARCLSPGGVFAVETPNLHSLDARLFKRTYWGGYHIPRHWHLFTPATLAALFERHGLEVVVTTYQTGHSFWMYSFHHLLRYNRRRPLSRIARWFDPTIGLPMLVAFTGLDKLRAGLRIQTSAMLMLARKRG